MMTPVQRGVAGLLWSALFVGAMRASTQALEQASGAIPAKHTTVLFICPHGAAKSVLASAYFQQLAKERGLNVRVDAAGLEPQEAVSSVVKEHLERNGYSMPLTKPHAVTKEELNDADVVISLGCDVSRLAGYAAGAAPMGRPWTE